MFTYNKILAIIPARRGSKGVPRKNIRNLNGKTLLAWSIESANSPIMPNWRSVDIDNELDFILAEEILKR